MKAVIMAGGKGTRLRPLTCNLPKPMVPIANRPMMSHIVGLVSKHGYDSINVTLCYLPHVVQNYFGDGRAHGVGMQYFVEDSPMGTAGSVKNAGRGMDQTFLVISGDALTDIDLTAALRFHRTKGAMVTVILSRVETPLEYGVVITGADGRIARFLEKPGWSEVFSDCVNTGIYLLEPEALGYIPDTGPYDFSKDLFPRLLALGAPLYGCLAGGYWSDIGNLEQYRESQYDVLRGKIAISPGGLELAPGVWAGEGTEVHSTASLHGPAYIGSGSSVAGDAVVGEYSILGDGVHLGERASVKRSILWSGSHIGPGCELRGAVVCNGVVLRANTAAYEGSVVGEKSLLGERAMVLPSVKIWPGKRVDPGTVLSDSLIWGTRASRALFGSAGVSGGTNTEITPEFAARLAAAFASTLPHNSSVVVGADGYRSSRMIKRAVISGLLSSGANVYDLGTLTTPVTRYAVLVLHAAGGIQVRLSPLESSQSLLEFIDQGGLNLERGRERAVENAFFCEDFRRVNAESVGEVVFVPRLIESYVDGLLRGADVATVARKGFRVVVDYDSGHLSILLPAALERLGCDVVPAGYREFGPHPRTLEQTLAALDTLSGKVRSVGANLGIVVDNNAERLILVDENGALVQDEQLLALIALVVLKYSAPEALPLPVTAPAALEEMAKEFHVKVERTKASPRSQMERLAEQRIFEEPGTPRFQPTSDALISLAKVLELMAREDLTLSQLVSIIPPIHMSKQTVDCPWKVKGQVMRSLIEENGGERVEMIDGLKVYHDNGWALVLPDSDQPVFRVYSEASSQEEADALARLYMGRIEALQEQ